MAKGRQHKQTQAWAERSVARASARRSRPLSLDKLYERTRHSEYSVTGREGTKKLVKRIAPGLGSPAMSLMARYTLPDGTRRTVTLPGAYWSMEVGNVDPMYDDFTRFLTRGVTSQGVILSLKRVWLHVIEASRSVEVVAVEEVTDGPKKKRTKKKPARVGKAKKKPSQRPRKPVRKPTRGVKKKTRRKASKKPTRRKRSRRR